MSSVLFDRLKRTALAVAGLVIFAFGIYLQLQADIGQAPWNALNQGLSMRLPITYGTACNVVACCIVIVDITLKEPIGLGMILDAFVIGWATDIFIALDWIPVQTSLALQIPCHLAGMTVLCIGQLIYMKAALGCGPRDALMIALGKRFTKVSVGTVNMCIFVIVLAGAFVLGAPIGIGTVLAVALMGPIMDLVFKIAHFDARGIQHESLLQTMRAIAESVKNKTDSAE